jgi:hypothetical protein
MPLGLRGFCINIRITTFRNSLTEESPGVAHICWCSNNCIMFNQNLTPMKKFTLTLCGLALVVLTIAQEIAGRAEKKQLPGVEAAIFKWEATEFEFGPIKKGVPVIHEFSFTNSGDIALIISSVQASCGCTVTSYTKDPIQPDGTGYVKATYNAAHSGKFNKTITVNANTDNAVTLTIKGEVVE